MKTKYNVKVRFTWGDGTPDTIILHGNTINVKVHFTWGDGTPDTIILRGNTIKEVSQTIIDELKKRNAKYDWSEDVR